MKTWLILSHGFNMDGRASSLTVTDKIPYLLDRGIEPIVLSAVTGKKDVRFTHYQLLPWGPSGFRFDFRHWLAVKYGRGIIYKTMTFLVSFLLLPLTGLERMLFGLSSQSSWFLPAAFKGIRLVRQGKIDLMYSSGGAWSAHLAALLIKKATGIKWIAEIHDPMVMRSDASDDGFCPKKDREARFLQKLEGLVCENADHVWWFTSGALAYARKRNPVLGERGFFILPGAEPPGAQKSLSQVHEYSKHLNFCHFGSLAEDRSLAPFLEALDLFFKKMPTAREKIRVRIYGANLDKVSKLAVVRMNMQSIVIEQGRIENNPKTGETGREQILKFMRTSDVLLLLHGTHEWCAEYIPSKLYDYFWTTRPIFAITHRNSQLDEILLSRNAYLSHTLAKTSILEAIQVIWDDWQKKSLPIMPYKPISPKNAVDEILSRIAT